MWQYTRYSNINNVAIWEIYYHLEFSIYYHVILGSYLQCLYASNR